MAEAQIGICNGWVKHHSCGSVHPASLRELLFNAATGVMSSSTSMKLLIHELVPPLALATPLARVRAREERRRKIFPATKAAFQPHEASNLNLRQRQNTMKAKTEKKPKATKAAVQLKDLKPKKNPKGGLIGIDP